MAEVKISAPYVLNKTFMTLLILHHLYPKQFKTVVNVDLKNLHDFLLSTLMWARNAEIAVRNYMRGQQASDRMTYYD